jgi:ABC-type nitrate/sulfonate/bicarbonate transport system substrate-binding protein
MLVTLIANVGELRAQALIKVPFPYSPINSSSLPWMIAKDAKVFEKHGLDVDLVYFGASSLILQTMLSGSANYAGFAGPAIISNVLKGGDVITIGALTPMSISLLTRASIEKGEDLRGNVVATFTSPMTGVVLMMFTTPVRSAGDTILIMGKTDN